MSWELAKEKFNTCEFRSEAPIVKLWKRCGPCPPKPYTSFYCSKFDIFPFTNYACCETCEEYQKRVKTE